MVILMSHCVVVVLLALQSDRKCDGLALRLGREDRTLENEALVNEGWGVCVLPV